MAEKIERPDKAAVQAAQDLGVLFPDQRAQIAGRDIVMREPSWVEELKLDLDLDPVIEELSQLGQDGVERDPMALQRIVWRHKDVMLEMMALCAGVERGWIEGLNSSDGRRLCTLFWAVNAHFFGERLALRRASRGRTGAMHVGPTSSRVC